MSKTKWTEVALKSIATLYNGNSIKDEDKDLYTDINEAIPYISTKDISTEGQLVNYENGMYVKRSDTSFSIAKKDDVLICLEGGSAGKKIAFLNQEVAFVNKLCCVHAYNVDPLFMFYAMQTNEFKDNFYSNLTGLIGGVNVRALGCIKMPLPDPAEQRSIANYLKEYVSQIDWLIELIEKAINLEEENMRAVITRAVTKGIKECSNYVDSGVYWIGDIPNTWQRSRISWIRRRPTAYGIIKLGDMPTDDGIPVLRCSDVRHGYIDYTGIRTVAKELSSEFSRTILNGGEVLINVRGTLGGCAVVPQTCAGWNIAREVAMIDVLPEHDSRFVKYFLMGEHFWSYLNSNLAGSVYQGLNIEMLERAEIAIPPKEEQAEIADYLDRKFNAYQQRIQKEQQLLNKLKEYRSTLITEVATGKIKVPGVDGNE